MLTVPVPLVVIFALVVFLAWRYLGLRLWHALACVLFGFLVAATMAAPAIQQALAALTSWITGQ
ncbi:hypothetical protein [Spongiactinospora sp. 9N601]|uniref:hypothetical protein n=1 Tax=Spongiactinospora sp. 9N601 TaxID=3375149 RepID=UPI00379EE9CC